MDANRDAWEALKALVEQIRMANYKDELGHDLKLNVAYREALTLLIIRGVLRP